MSSDSISNEMTESEENVKESAERSCSDFQSPPCSSSAFSLMMADSEHNPSTSGYSSEQPAKAKTQKDLLKTLKELRSYLPPDKRTRGKSSIAASLRYALHCIQQVKAKEEYYQTVMVNGQQSCGLDVSCYTVQEIASITSEYTRNNMDTFAVAVSLVTGRILYISDQASVVLRCESDVFSHVRFVELIAPQDASVFYSSTSPYRLPSWSISSGADSGPLDAVEEKSFYCRISCGRESRKEISYHPFRMTPYLIRAQEEGSTEPQLCCVLFAERIHSGYEAPRIPADKRIFTTTHTPSCLFQDVDERAVPLLGYLPQDLIGSPILLHLHPKDRQMMVAVHKKILHYGGQPFDFTPIRFCARNGEYVTIDTSWSSFINPWSRKVSFIIGRHKVRMGPVNEDVFTAPLCNEDRSLNPEIQEITEQIHQLLMQPVHNSSSSGYGSLGSNGSHENPMSGSSSSDSNGNLNDDMKDKQAASHEQSGEEQGTSSLEIADQQNLKKKLQADLSPSINNHSKDITEDLGSVARPIQSEEVPARRCPYSYQQISCLDGVIRYLESCVIPTSPKRKWISSGNTLLSSSKNDQNPSQERVAELEECDPNLRMPLNKDVQTLSKAMPGLPTCSSLIPVSQPVSAPGPVHKVMTVVTDSCYSLRPPLPVPSPSLNSHSVQGSALCLPITSLPVAGPSSCPALNPLSLGPKAESVVSFTSLCSYSSTIVHVGDKKLQPETELEDGPSVLGDPLPAVGVEKEPYKQLGLTKEVLAAHTQREENDFLAGFMDIKKLSAFQTRCNSYLHERPHASLMPCTEGPDTPGKKYGKTRRSKAKRVRPESWDSSSSGHAQPPRCPLPGLNTTAWSQSDTSHASCHPLPYQMLPAYPLPVFPAPHMPVPSETAPVPTTSTCPMQPFSAPLLPPMVALVLPNYMYPPNPPPSVFPESAQQHVYPAQSASHGAQPTFPASQPTFPPSLPTFSTPQSAFPSPQLAFPAPQPAFPTPQPAFPAPQPTFTTPQPMLSALQPAFSIAQPTFPVARPIFPVPQTNFPAIPSSYTPQPVQNSYPGQPYTYQPSPHTKKLRERVSRSSTTRDPPSPPLFQSRCSSPLQLNLLQLEEAQKAEHPEGGTGELDRGARSSSVIPPPSEDSELLLSRARTPEDAHTSDAVSTCSDLMDLLLQEDASSGRCSASSESMTTESRGNETSGSQTGSSLTSRSSKYFGCVDLAKCRQKVQELESSCSKNVMKYILQDPMWLLMANADENVMMTYQMPQRDQDTVLKEDREKLKSLHKLQPHFTEEQKKELVETHGWMQKGVLPQAMEGKECIYCKEKSSDCAEYGEAIQELEMSGMMESCD
ncbi:period circadian protein homolog 2-like isoform 2-T2 [Rhinophrynus dorsalis]